MKRILFALFALFFISLAGISKKFDDSQLSDRALRTMDTCMALVHDGQYEAALERFDRLVKEYPESYVVQYERMCALYRLRRYDETVKAAKALIKQKNATGAVYQVYGNALDDAGQTAEAIKIYNEGVKLFSDAGNLYLELGVINMREKKYGDAIAEFEKGIVADPDFASNYYRAAQILFGSDNSNVKVWALVYGESAALLAPTNQNRMKEMARNIRELWKKSIEFSDDGVRISLVEGKQVNINIDGENAELSFANVYEGCAGLAVLQNMELMNPFTASLEQLIVLRKGLVESYFKVTDNLFGNSMYLLPYLKSLIDAGHWEAYNYFLFGSVFPEDFDKWIEDNEDKLYAFAAWYNEHPYVLDATHTVCDLQIDRDRRKISLMEALMIAGSFNPDKDSSDDSSDDPDHPSAEPPSQD